MSPTSINGRDVDCGSRLRMRACILKFIAKRVSASLNVQCVQMELVSSASESLGESDDHPHPHAYGAPAAKKQKPQALLARDSYIRHPLPAIRHTPWSMAHVRTHLHPYAAHWQLVTDTPGILKVVYRNNANANVTAGERRAGRVATARQADRAARQVQRSAAWSMEAGINQPQTQTQTQTETRTEDRKGLLKHGMMQLGL